MDIQWIANELCTLESRWQAEGHTVEELTTAELTAEPQISRRAASQSAFWIESIAAMVLSAGLAIYMLVQA